MPFREAIDPNTPPLGRYGATIVLRRCGGSPAEAARALGIGRTTLWRKLRAWGAEGEAAPRG